MALLCAGIDADIIKLVGRWRSDAMFRYLHAQALPIVRQLAKSMVNHGEFTLARGAFETEKANRILNTISNLEMKQKFHGSATPIDKIDEDFE